MVSMTTPFPDKEALLSLVRSNPEQSAGLFRELEIRLDKNSQNSSKPPSSDGYKGGLLVYWTGLTVGELHLCYMWGSSNPPNTNTLGARIGEVFPSGVGWAFGNTGWIQPTC